jgi:CheY-like chemotaxis protein
MANPAAERTNGKIKILVIDDEPAVGDALKLVLEASDYEVVLVENGREGIRQARKNHFTLMIIDFCLPDISGLEVFEAIREQGCQAPVIIITADVSPQVFAEAQNLGVVGILSKPFSPSAILQLCAKALAQ